MNEWVQSHGNHPISTVQPGKSFENHESSFGMITANAFFYQETCRSHSPVQRKSPHVFHYPLFFLHNLPVRMPDAPPIMYSIIEFRKYRLPGQV